MKADRLRHSILTCAIALSALAIFCGCHVNRPGADHEKNQILYSAVASDPRTFNPILVTDSTSGELTGDLFDSLLRINPVTTLPEAGLAEKWEIAPDNKAITFHLRHDVKWFDGQPFTAHDVLFTLDVIYDPKVPNSIRPAITIDHQRITAEAPDDYTVIMHLPKPFAPLLYSLGIQVIPAHILEPIWKAGNFNHTWGIDTSPDKLVGNGPYHMTHYTQGQVVRYDRNENYWMKDEHGGQLPRLHGQTVTIVPDPVPDNMTRLSIGFAHSGAEMMLVDEEGQPIESPGVIGEIYLRSPALFTGYWDDPQATRDVLVPDPLNPCSGQTVFRSGDLGYRGPDGEFYFCGRMDSQVKIRGNRVELGELERRLTQAPGVAAATALLLPRPDGELALAAFVVMKPDSPPPDRKGLRAFCAQSLPGYMVPGKIGILDELPLTGNGKIDRAALADHFTSRWQDAR